MIVSGIGATAHADLQGHVPLGGAVDIAQRVPLCFEHGLEIGEVTFLMYAGHDLHLIAETDDAEALKLDYFSVAGRALEREQRGNLWHVTKFRLTEISLVRSPQNDRCVVIERKASDPFRALHKTRIRQLDLFADAFRTLSSGLQAMVKS